MPSTIIIKLKLRRGTNEQRKLAILEQGEFGYTTDTKRVFIGDGLTYGGNVVGSKFNLPISNTYLLTSLNSIQGDVVYAGTTLYQLTGTNFDQISAWGRLNTNVSPDNITLEYTGDPAVLSVKANSIGSTSFATNAAYNLGGLVATPSNGLSAKVDASTITITNNNTLSVGKIDQRHMLGASFGDGLVGGDGTQVRVNANSDFTFQSGVLVLSTLPAEIVTTDNLSPTFVGAGLTISSNQLVTNVQSVDDISIQLVGNQLSLKPFIGSGNTFFKTATFNTAGQITGVTESITETLTGANSTSSYLSVFNGWPSQLVDGAGYTNQTILTSISGNGITTESISLTSAGFITFSNTIAADGSAIGRFAIPIFNY